MNSYIVYPAAVARCTFGDQMKTEDVTQGAHVQVAGLEQGEVIFANHDLHNKYIGSK